MIVTDPRIGLGWVVVVVLVVYVVVQLYWMWTRPRR